MYYIMNLLSFAAKFVGNSTSRLFFPKWKNISSTTRERKKNNCPKKKMLIVYNDIDNFGC